ncbi:MAG: serine hydrolase [Sphingomonadales bacterium]|nr:serine hydrolase [Sphingomonadales bacterium]NCO48925.1 serine hydrolase [Sphingomonadales bacterium]NCP01280.1 serine hydrolase [Sphingomonadales bacterium]NCP26420.1 serine hydrolase [Sphingomonadales bacterium]NCP42884.1 serine hydrolase [Sphingomonadales bacterium]
MRFLYTFALCLLSCSAASFLSPAYAQTEAAISQQLSARADDVLRLLQGEEIEAEVFDENFRNAVPPAQFRALTRQVSAQQGQPLEIVSIAPSNANSAILRIRFEKSIGVVNIDLENSRPHRISGLQLTGFEAAGQSIPDILAAIDALPGRQGVLIQQLDGGDGPPIAALDPDGRYAIASAFKLYILAELDRAIQAGERRWSDVVQLGPKSHPSGVSQNWPDASPVTLQTLATLMISISDNSATDTLIRVIGQDRLAAIVTATGHHDPAELRPFLMTRQASALKMPVHADRRGRFLAAGPAERETLLAEFDPDLPLDSLDFRILTGRPNFIDQLEWFATPQDMIKLLQYIDQNASEETRAILAINPGIGLDAARKWAHFGYKGGSEPGVLSYNFLLRAKSGQGYAVSVNWNNGEQSLQESELLALTTSLINLLAAQ